MVLGKAGAYCRRAALSLRELCVETVEWRRPVASSLYLLLTNALFWYMAFYLDHDKQEWTLLCVSSFSLSHFISHRISFFNPLQHPVNAKNDFIEFHQKPVLSQGAGVVRFLLIDVIFGVVSWPVVFLWRWFRFSALELVTCILCSGSVYLLRKKEIEQACWMGYATVLLVVVTPPWRYNQVNAQILNSIVGWAEGCGRVVRDRVWRPLVGLILGVGRALRYYMTGEWVPPLIERLKRAYSGLKHALRTRLVDPVWGAVCSVGRTVRYYLCGHWIPPLLRRLRAAWTEVCGWFHGKVVDPWCRFCGRVWEIFVYVVLFGWVPPLLDWLRVKIVDPLIWHLTHLRESLHYILTGQWIPGLLRSLRALPRRLLDFLVFPFCAWLRESGNALKLWLRRNIVHPTLSFCKRSLYRTKRFIRNRILRPFIRYTIMAMIACMEAVYAHVLRPALLLVSVSLKRFKHYARIQWVDPGVGWVKERLPEKSPFVDDSDTELQDFLPEDVYKGMSRAHSEAEESEETGLTPGGSAGPASARMSRNFSDESLDDDERDFINGLAFPSVRESESSEEEFSLRQKGAMTKEKSRRKKKRLTPAEIKREDLGGPEFLSQGQEERRDSGDLGDIEIPQAVPDIDDDFEILEPERAD